MSARTLDAQVRYQPHVAIVDLRGEIDSFAEGALNSAYAEVESRKPETILLNFAAVDYINSTGIALIVGLLARARKNHQRLHVFGLSPHYVEIFQITRLADYMTVFPDEASALGAEQSQA